MATSRVQVTEGSGKNLATYSFTEDAVTKDAQRAILNNSAGTEIGTSSNPVQVSLANTATNATAVKVDASATTQPISVASLPLPSGASTETTLGTRLSESDFDTKTGSLTEAAPASDTASSGLNGRLQRIAQRLTSLITAVGTPFQAGGSIGNTSFASTQSGTWTVQPGNTANTTAWKVDGSAVTQPVSGTVSITANSAVNVAQINGVATSMGAGANGTGVQRVTLATDQTAVSTAGVFSVKVDQTTVGTTNAVSLAQLGANAVATGNGASSTGVLRVAQVNDGTGVLATVSTVTTLTGGAVAHDAADSGNPIKVGAKASATLSDDTMVANADRTDLTSDLDGAVLVRTQFPLGDILTERIADTSGTSTAFTNFAATASTRNYINAVSVYNASATPGYIDFRDGTAGSVLYTVGLPAGGGAIIANGGSPLFRTTANTALAYDVSAALTTVYISVTGFKSKV